MLPMHNSPILMSMLVLFSGSPTTQPAVSIEAMRQVAVEQLVAMQEQDGAWPYEGVYRVAGEIPLGYRVAGTAIVAGALTQAAPKDPAVIKAVDRGLRYVLSRLDDPLMHPSSANRYDVRVWGHIYALEFLSILNSRAELKTHQNQIRLWIPKLVEALRVEQLDDGGWNYATRNRHAPFVTAIAIQSLLHARDAGATVPKEMLVRGRAALLSSRLETGAYTYSGTPRKRGSSRDKVPGSIARASACEATLSLLGDQNTAAQLNALNDFHRHWNELEKRRKQHGTHVPPYGIAPYYFYYGHRYAAQAIQVLPAELRKAQRSKLLEVILKTRDPDGTWNDRVFPRSRNYGTAMILLALLGDQAQLPPRIELKQ